MLNNEASQYFTGKICKRGHSGLRYKNGGACVECNKSRKEYQANYRKKRLTTPHHIATALFLSCRSRQRQKHPNAPFDLTKEWIKGKIEHGFCEVTGLPFCLDILLTSKRPFSPSIDKIDPKGSYTKDNCQVVCFIYNVAKGEFTHDDVMRLAKSLIQ